MKKLQFSIDIKAPKETVWNTLWSDKTYPKWTTVFSEGSQAVSDWKQGSKVHFLDGKGAGMYSKIDQIQPNKLMAFKHIGEIKEGREQPVEGATKNWSGSMETYTLHEKGDKTHLMVEIDASEEHQAFFSEKFPLALEKVKELAERK